MRDSTIGVALIPDKDYRLLGTQGTLDGVKSEKSSRKLAANPPEIGMKCLLWYLVALGRPGRRDPQTSCGAHLPYLYPGDHLR